MAENEGGHDDNTPPVTDPPAPPTPPTPPTPPAPPATPPATDSDLRDTVAGLTETVAGLVSAVAALTPTPRDEAPVRVPWTHRGSRPRND